MTHPFPTWNERIDQAADEHARRALLGEIGVWRAQHLTDIPAQREASYALSEVYAALGEREQAAHEAQQLVALCRVQPSAPQEALRFAEKHARGLTRRERPKKKEKKPRKERAVNERTERPSREDGRFDAAVAAAVAGRWAEAREGVQGRRGARAQLFRVWTRLGEALAAEGEARETALAELEGWLRSRIVPDDKPAAKPAEVAEVPAEDDDSPLAAILGQPTARRRDALVDQLDAFAVAHPERVDELAAAALRHHVATRGRKAVAPWLVGLTARALALSGGDVTRAAVADLSDAYATTAYGEAPFQFLVDVLRAAVAAGWAFEELRRGALRRGVPADRKTWTLRLVKDDVRVMVASAPPSDEPLTERAVQRLATRLAELGERALLHAVGSGNAGLREAARAAGLSISEGDAASVVGALADVTPHAPVAAPPTNEEPATAPTPAAPAADATPDPLAEIEALFDAEEAPDAEAWAGPLGRLRRGWRAFVPLRPRLAADDLSGLDARFATFLGAVNAAVPADVRLAEGLSMALLVAAKVPDGAVASLLAADDEVGQRFGGARVGGLLDVLRVLFHDGFTLDRVLVGVTRREQRSLPGLDALAEGVDGIWRAVVEKDGNKAEVWWVNGPSAEARAAAPQLLLEARDRVVVSAPDQPLDGFTPPHGSPVVVWTGAEADAIREATSGWFAEGGEG